MPTLQRLEVWTDLQCAGGSRTAILPLDQVTRLVTTERVTREDDGTLELSKDAAAYTYLSVGAVIRLLYTDAAFEEWRIAEMQDTSQSSRLVRVSLQSVLFELNVRDNPITSTASNITTLDVSYSNQTPTQLVTAIMAFAPSWFDVGTVTPTTLVDVSVSSAYPLRALRQVVDALRAKGVSCELDFRRNGTTGYYIDLVTSIGSSATAVDVRTAKNLLATTRTARLPEQATTVIMRGATGVRRSTTPATIALGFWKVASVSGSDVELRGAEDCPDPILYDDQFNSHYLQKTDGTYTQITDTVASTQKVTVASAASISANQWLRIVSNSSGDDMVKLSKPTATAPLNQSRILTVSGLSDRTNWCVNPVFSRWTAGAPNDWTETDASSLLTLAEDTSRYYFGDRSAKLTFANPTGINATARLTSRAMSIAPSATTRTFVASFWLYFDHAASTFGALSIPIRCALGSSTVDTTFSAAAPSPTNGWVRIDVTASSTSGASLSAYVEFRHNFTVGAPPFITAVVNIGGVMIEELSTVQSSMFVGSQPAYLHAAGNRALGLYSAPPTAYTVSFADLEAWDASAFPYDNVALGATANVRDTDLGVTTAERIVELTRDRRNPLASQLTVSTRPVDLVSTLTGIADL